MIYTKENLPEEFTAINTADTPLHVIRISNERFCVSSEKYSEDFYYKIETIINCLNGPWKNIKIFKYTNYEIY
jgi:hypothetical protein